MVQRGARGRALDLVVAFRQAQCVRVAPELELADLLAQGPRSATELADATGSYEPFLRRLLRALASLEHVHGSDVWEYYASHPDDGARFDAAMAGLTRGSSEAIVAVYDFGQFRYVVDVGGGDGTLLAAILREAPDTRGVLVDVEHVVDRARRTLEAVGVLHRAELHAGDFRRSVPP